MVDLHSIDMVLIEVRDWAAAIAWYQDVLGLKLEIREDDDKFCILSAPHGSCKLALYEVEHLTLDSHNRCMPVILTPDLAETLNGLREKNVLVTKDISGEEEGYRSATITDLEGNSIVVYQWM